VIHIGASLPLTGPYEKVSRICKNGYDFWTKTYGGKMVVAGKEREVKWTIYDDERGGIRRDAAPAIQWVGNPAVAKIVAPNSMSEFVGTYPKQAW